MIDFSERFTIIQGQNGCGKTSIMEAIYYVSYGKSFRSNTVQDILSYGADAFFLKAEFFDDVDQMSHTLQIGHGYHAKKAIKFDQKSIHSFKQLLFLFQTVSLTEDDIDLIKGSPAPRRAFIDHAVIVANPEMIDVYSEFRKILYQRNAFLYNSYQGSCNELEYDIWTEKLQKISQNIQALRMAIMLQVQERVNELLMQFFDGIYQISLQYQPKNHENLDLVLQEKIQKRSLFGAHLDDIVFHIQGKKACVFASRGQQKLIILLSKWALATLQGAAIKPVFLMDDFISDFDKLRVQNLINLFLDSQNQIILTLPYLDHATQSLFEPVNLNKIMLD